MLFFYSASSEGAAAIRESAVATAKQFKGKVGSRLLQRRTFSAVSCLYLVWWCVHMGAEC